MTPKILRVLALSAFAALPITVYASWQLGTRVMSGGGSLQVRSDTPMTSGSGTIYKTYTTTSNVPISSAANTGYFISRYSINGTNYTPATKTDTFFQNMGLIAFPGVTSQTFTVTFSPWMTSVTVNAGDNGGSVSPYGTSSLQYTTTRNYTFTPNAGNQVVAIEGLPPSGYTLSPDTIPAPLNTPVVLNLTVPTAPLTISGYFLGVVANAGPTRTVAVPSIVTLDGSGSTIKAGGGSLAYSWTQTGGPSVTLSATNVAKPTFTAFTSSTYNFKLTVTNGTYTNFATTAVTATKSAVATARTTCNSCHQGVGIGVAQQVFPNWSSSSHKRNFVMCANCHVGADTGGHPGNLTSGMVDETKFTYSVYNVGQNFCFTCHHMANNLHYNTEVQLAGICVACHKPDVHNPAATMDLAVGYNHFNGYTSYANPNHRAAYVTPATQCANCHLTVNGMPDAASDPALLRERTDWAGSGHGDTNGAGWNAADFKTASGCVRCHTAPGFIAYSTSSVTTAWGSESDRTKGVLSCNGCHSDIGTGAVRHSPPARPYADDTYQTPDAATSNLCITCHSGVRSGRSIRAQSDAGADFGNLPFIGSHVSAAAGVLFRSIGYEYAFKNYSNSWHFKHDRIGKGHFKAYGYDSGVDGPCVGCHMTSPNAHSFSPVTVDGGGAVTAVVSTSCAACHSGPAYLDAARINARKSKFAASLRALQKVLETKGIYFADTSPYFFRSVGNTDPENAFTGWGNPDTMGAAFNFNLLQHEPGAYAHNMVYAKRLIYDSIDHLDNGLLDDSVVTTINGLAGMDPSQKASASGYLAPAAKRP